MNSPTKRPLNPQRQRQVPAHFSRLDHWLVRNTTSRRLTSAPGRCTCFSSVSPTPAAFPATARPASAVGCRSMPVGWPALAGT